ncbi:MAG: hypothetical protein JJE52_01885 [Acidimicrobiia bacterium]|nr:hypothetical protein [Acidimicrobiia bacterium]
MRWIDRRLFAPTPRAHTELLQLALALVMGTRLATSRYWELSDMPSVLFAPPWFLSGLSEPPSAAVLAAVQAVGLAGGLFVLISRGRSRPAFVVTWCALVVLAGVQTSGGKILHNDVLLLLAAAPFLLPCRSVRTSGDGPARVEGWQRRTAMVLVALGYMCSGLMKLRHSGLEWVFGENLRWVLYAGANREGSILPTIARAIAGQLWLTVVIAGATIATEVLFPLALVWRRARVLLAAGAVALHVAVFLLLGLDYWTWVASVVILFVLDPSRVYSGRSQRTTSVMAPVSTS